jgi:hypothetical protein
MEELIESSRIIQLKGESPERTAASVTATSAALTENEAQQRAMMKRTNFNGMGELGAKDAKG